MSSELPTKEHLEHMENLSSGLLRKVTPDHVAEDLIKRGWASNRVGGLLLTEVGYKTFLNANGKR